MTTGRINQIAIPIASSAQRAARDGQLFVSPGASSSLHRKDSLRLANVDTTASSEMVAGRTIVRRTDPRPRPGLHRTVKSVLALVMTDSVPLDRFIVPTACRRRERLSAGQSLCRLYQLLSHVYRSRQRAHQILKTYIFAVVRRWKTYIASAERVKLAERSISLPVYLLPSWRRRLMQR